jgi:allantoate deiminase
MGVAAMKDQPAPPAMGEAIAARLRRLAAISDEDGALTRLYLSPAHRQAADLVMNWMREAGLSARVDAVGNVVGRVEAERPGAKTLILGSHIDTVRGAGAYDGNLGVVTAIEVVSALRELRRPLPFAIEIVAFGDEEGVRFPSALGGSRALAGAFDPAILDERDADGVSRREALIAFGCDPRGIAQEARKLGDLIGYVEVHIEQGPVLEAENRPVGVVTGISGASRGIVRVEGESAHAGTTPMPLRRDALVAAGLMVSAVEGRARREPDLVATIGRLEIDHAAANTIPGAVSFSLDIRAPDDETRRDATRDIIASIEQIAGARGLRAQVEIGYEAPCAHCDPALSRALAASVERMGLELRRLPSGAGHDAMAFRERIPFAMLFVRCKAGLSHNPGEYASPHDIDVGARVLLDFITRLTPDATQGD